MISLTTEVQNALESNHYRAAILANFPGGASFKVTDSHKDIVYNSVTYSATGEALMKTSNISRTSTVGAASYTITFSGADQSAIAEYDNNAHIGKSAYIYMAFLDDNYDLLASDSVIKLYEGIVDAWDLSESATTSEFSIKLTSHWATFEVTNGRFTNQSSQKEYYSTDNFFTYAYQDELPLKWGS